jgi:hypothetical protein
MEYMLKAILMFNEFWYFFWLYWKISMEIYLNHKIFGFILKYTYAINKCSKLEPELESKYLLF